jgi:DNA-binding transcriptional MerR regulator
MNSSNLKTYTIEEVSKQLNVPQGSIKRWEKSLKDVLIIPRTKQGARFYTENEISVLKNVKEMIENKTSIKKISKILKKQFIEESGIIHDSVSDVAAVSEADADSFPEINLKIAEVPIADVDIVADGASVTNEVSEEFETSLIQFSPPPTLEEQREAPNLEDFFNLMDVYKQNLLDEVKMEIRNGIRKEVVEEVKKEISKGSLQTVKSLSKSIQRLRKNSNSEFQELNEKITEAAEINTDAYHNLSTTIELSSQNTFKTFEMLANNISESSEVTSGEITSLGNQLMKSSNQLMNSSKASTEEVKNIINKISTHQEETNNEISHLVDSINKDREIFIETLNEERMHFSREIRSREAVFQNLVTSFRNSAAAKEEKVDRKWWKFWKKQEKQKRLDVDLS